MIDHREGHPCLHACAQVDAATREAIARQVDRLDLLLLVVRTEAEQQEAVALVESLYEQTRGTACNCRVAGWYVTTRMALGVPPAWDSAPGGRPQ